MAQGGLVGTADFSAPLSRDLFQKTLEAYSIGAPRHTGPRNATQCGTHLYLIIL